jgi:DNA-binding transcriptional MerR regulator/methylmalonyl-CoA mutase cobalamin-binding subunit
MGRGIYKMRTISESTGFTPAVLRAWERRHGLLVPERTEGGHRLYTEEDMLVLQRVRALLDEGRAIGEIAGMGRERLLEAPSLLVSRREPLPEDLSGRLEGWSKEIVQASLGLDEAGLENVLDEAFAVTSPDTVIQRVIAPALETIGELWARGLCSVAGEHLASHKISGRLLRLLEASNPSAGGTTKTAITACLPDELHQIGALVASYTLARHGYRVIYLGAALPVEDLERACRTLAPSLVLLSVTRPELVKTHGPGLCDMFKRQPGVRFLVGGSGVAQGGAALEGTSVELISSHTALVEVLEQGQPAGGEGLTGSKGELRHNLA